MSEITKISFIGAGNLAWHLAPALENCGYSVTEVYSRNSKNAEKLVERLYAAAGVESLDFSNSSSEIFIIATTDDAIEDIAREIVLPENSILTHTSGTIRMDVLSFSAADSTGVFYPLQTFSRDLKIDLRDVPILIEASDKSTHKKLTEMGRSLSKNVIFASSEDRKLIHLAAVFAGNLTNHLITKAKLLVEKRGYNFDILKPLIQETINKCLSQGPENAQTGPAKRQDFNTFEEHVQMLDDETLQEIYKLISQDIIDHYG